MAGHDFSQPDFGRSRPHFFEQFRKMIPTQDSQESLFLIKDRKNILTMRSLSGADKLARFLNRGVCRQSHYVRTHDFPNKENLQRIDCVLAAQMVPPPRNLLG